LNGFLGVLEFIVRRDNNNPGSQPGLPDFLDYLKAVQAGHANIDEAQVRL
jgi:hypothetical protein